MSSGQTVILRGDPQRDLAKALIDRAPANAVITMREETRTTEQSAKMWALLSDIARAKPDGRIHTTEQWKAIFMASCDHKPMFLPSLDGDDFICAGYKSSRLTKAEMSDVIESILAYGSQHGVVWSERFDDGR